MRPYQTKQHIQIRDAEQGDHSFLFSTYLQNNWYDKTQSTTLKKGMWMALQHKRLEKVLSETDVKVACFSDDPDTIIGYAFRDPEKPFVYIKRAWRMPDLNISKLLTESLEEK